MQSTSSVRTFRPTPPEEPQKDKKEKKPKKLRKEKQPKAEGADSTSRAFYRSPVLPWIVVFVLVAASVFLFLQYRQAQDKISTNGQAAIRKQTDNVVSNVGKLIILPKGQTPTVATVQNVEKLKDQPFFANAKNGDKVLVYNSTKQALLYRPSTNQLVNVSTVSVQPQ